jgi:hypothetical protein
MPDIPAKGAEAAWGGIGGSGKHAGEVFAELASHPQFNEVINRLPKVAWGGIGGSGKHPSGLEPEISTKSR